MDNTKTLQALLSDPAMPAPIDWVLASLRQYPAFYLPAAILLKRNPQDADPETLHRLQALVSVECPDRAAMADFVDLARDGWDNFYPPAAPPAQKDTDQTIDAFIRKYGHSSPEEDARIEQLIFNPVPADYFPEAEDGTGSLALPPELDRSRPAGQKSVDSPAHEATPARDTTESHDTVADTTAEAPRQEKTAEQEKTAAPDTRDTSPKKRKETPADEQPLMESLARIYIKRQSYGRAYEIISKLSLKYPEKSVYFADQLRFLQKLMINQQHKG